MADLDAVEARLSSPEGAAIRASLEEIGIRSAVDLFGTYAGGRDDMAAWLRGAAINTDRNLRLQYLAGLGANLYESAAIYQRMIRDTRFPERLFTGSPQTLDALRAHIARTLSAARGES